MPDYENNDSTRTEEDRVILNEKIQRLEAEKEALKQKVKKFESKPLIYLQYILILFGVGALTWSIYQGSTVLAFIGLSLTFWGVIFQFIKKVKYVQSDLLNAVIIPNSLTIMRIISDLGFEGKAVYLPPSAYKSKDYKEGLVFISLKKNAPLPRIEEISPERVFQKHLDGLCLIPPGLDLVNFFEEELGKELIQEDFKYLKDQLPKLFVEKLEIATGLKIKENNNQVNFQISDSIFLNTCKQIRDAGICKNFGCPLCSSIACALTRTLGKPVIIEKAELINNESTINIIFSILEV
jgi:hypothetical protein